MKRDPRKRITSVLLSLALMLTMVALPSMAMPVQAAEIETGNQAAFHDPKDNGDGTTTYQYVYFGENGGQAMKWRVLESTTEELFLLSENSVGNKSYHMDNHAYNGSYVNLHLTMTDPAEFLAGFKEAELNGISKQIVWGGDNKGIDRSISDPNGVYFYVLSTEEASTSTYFPNGDSDRKLSPDSSWWLRSAGNYDYYAAIVDGIGLVFPYGDFVFFDFGVRPAFKINLTSVIFSSSAAGGKPTTVGANLSAATQPTAEQKLTVIDSGQTLNVIATTAEQSQTDSTLSFSYDGATTGINQWVSCVLTDSGGAVEYYGKLKNTSSAGSGSLSIPIAGVSGGVGVADGTYTLRIFSEQDNRPNYTDFASDPVDMTVNVTGGKGTVSGYTGSSAVAPTINGSAAATDTINLFEGYTVQNKTYSITGTPAPNVSVTSDNDNTGASITNDGVLTIPAGLAKGIYTIAIEATNTQGSATMTVTVNVAEVPTAPTVTPASLTLQDGNTGTFSVTMGTGTYKATSVSIASDNTAVATVDTATLNADGTVTVTGIAEGNTDISLTWVGGSQDGTTSTVEVTVSKLPVVTHTITLGASGSGTVTGGGSYAENTSATVTATPNTGWHFVSWTENGAIVSTAASYTFVVKNNRSLVAEFEQGLVPIIAVTGIELSPAYWTMRRGFSEQVYAQIIPENASVQDVLWRSSNPAVATVDDTGWVVGVAAGTATITVTTVDGGFTANCYVTVTRDEIISSGSSSSSSGGGTSKPDVSPVAGRAFTKADAIKLFNAALAAKPEGQATLSIKARNYTSVDKTVLAELVALAQKNGVTLTVHFDTWVNNAVSYRISVNPAAITTNLDLTAKIAGGKITMPKLAIPTEVAVKMPVGMTIETLKITQSGKDITATAKPWLDKNGYLHFTSTGGEIVLGK